jgi:antagonist of KipI
VSVLRVLRPGALATIQDLGRWGHQALGVPVCGALDTWSHRVANRLVGNHEGAAAIEVTFGEFAATVDEARLAAVTGAPLDIDVDGRRLSSPAVFGMARGTHVTLGAASRGSRAYLAVRGGFDVPRVLGSRATDLRSGFGGLHGAALRVGDIVPLGPASPVAARLADAQLSPAPWLPRPAVATRLRVLASTRSADVAVARALTAAEWTLTPACDRMGYRLEGSSAPRIETPDVLTMPTAIGSIQVPPSGQPILLMSDRQTTGGYAQPAAVIAADLPVAAQLAPGDRVRFVACSLDEARAALVERESTFEEEA